MGRYDDMVYQARPESWHSKMRRGDRAKLFSPFDALNGFSSAIREKDFVYVPRIQLSEFMREGINRRLQALRHQDSVMVVYFVSMTHSPEEELGEYRAITASVVRVDDIARTLVLDTITIPFEDIMTVSNSDLEIMEDDYAGIQ